MTETGENRQDEVSLSSPELTPRYARPRYPSYLGAAVMLLAIVGGGYFLCREASPAPRSDFFSDGEEQGGR